LALAAVAPVSPVEAHRAVEDSPAVSAFGKLSRVLPRPVAERVVAVRAAVSTPPQVEGSYRRVPLPAILVALAESVVGRCRCRIRHRGQHGPPTVREANPYGIAALRGSWYLHAWCHLRQARRTFRVDRIDRVDILATTFSAPEGLDIVTAVERSLALARPEWSVELLVHAPLERVEDWVPRHLGILHAVDSRATGLRSSTSNLDYFAWQIGDLPFAMTVLTPQELRGAFERHAQRMRTVARR